MGPNPLTEREEVLVWALTCALSHLSAQRKFSDAELRRCVIILERIVKDDAIRNGGGGKVIDFDEYLRARRVRTPAGDDDGDGE